MIEDTLVHPLSGRHQTPEHIAKRVASNKANPRWVKHLKKLALFNSQRMKGKSQSEEHKAKISLSKGGIPCDTNRVCLYCSKLFTVPPSEIHKGAGLYCSRFCTDEGKKAKSREQKICPQCGNEFVVNKKTNRKFCSIPCRAAYHTKDKMRLACKECGIEMLLKPSVFTKGRKKYCSRSCHIKNRLKDPQFTSKVWVKGRKPSDEARKKLSLAQQERVKRGDNPLLVDGRSHLRRSERVNAMSKFEYRSWRRKVFERDDYICQSCNQRGGQLHADHIKPWSGFPELRYDVDNGRTLCISCHRKTPTYGGRK